MRPWTHMPVPPQAGHEGSVVFGPRLKELRKAAGLTQKELGEAIGLKSSAQGAVSKMELGSHTPSLSRLYALAKVLGCRPAALLEPPVHPRPKDPTVGSNIRWVREAAGMTATELGRRMGYEKPSVASAVISKIEIGRHMPSMALLSRIAQQLGCLPADLMEGVA